MFSCHFKIDSKNEYAFFAATVRLIESNFLIRFWFSISRFEKRPNLICYFMGLAPSPKKIPNSAVFVLSRHILSEILRPEIFCTGNRAGAEMMRQSCPRPVWRPMKCCTRCENSVESTAPRQWCIRERDHSPRQSCP